MSWKSLYPFASHFLPLDGEGTRLHYVDEGAGEPILFVHGNPTWSFHWRKLIGEFSARFRTIAPDHVGCGGSDKPADYSYTLAQHIANLRRLVEHLDLKNITLVAQDWGGAIGMGAAGEMPERFRRFVLFNTAAFRSTRIPWRIAACRIPIVGKIAIQGLNLFLHAAFRMALTHPDVLSATERSGYLAPYDTWSHRRAIFRFVQDIPLRPNHPSYATLAQVEQGLSQFRDHPVQLIWGMRDWCFTPHFLERVLEFFPRAEAHRLSNAGHWVVEEAHDQIIAIMRDFFDRNAGPDSRVTLQ